MCFATLLQGIPAGIEAYHQTRYPQMSINKLTDSLCKRATPSEKPRKLSDGHGLYLYITPAGSKIWRVGYRQNGKEGTEVLGAYPLLTLADARIKRDLFRRKLLDGIDVKAKPKKSMTFSEAVKAYWAGRKDLGMSHLLPLQNLSRLRPNGYKPSWQ